MVLVIDLTHAIGSAVTAVTSAKEAIRVLESTDVDTFQLILTVRPL